jgi:ferredoxin
LSYRIHVVNTGQTIDCAEDTTILSAAVAAGINFPYGCASGNCGLCMSKLHDGQVELLPHTDGALGPAQAQRGMTLACRAMPRSDVQLSWLANPDFD